MGKYEAMSKYEKNNINAADSRIEWAICAISYHNNEQFN
jgi:hypothetical protein